MDRNQIIKAVLTVLDKPHQETPQFSILDCGELHVSAEVLAEMIATEILSSKG